MPDLYLYVSFSLFSRVYQDRLARVMDEKKVQKGGKASSLGGAGGMKILNDPRSDAKTRAKW